MKKMFCICKPCYLFAYIYHYQHLHKWHIYYLSQLLRKHFYLTLLLCFEMRSDLCYSVPYYYYQSISSTIPWDHAHGYHAEAQISLYNFHLAQCGTLPSRSSQPRKPLSSCWTLTKIAVVRLERAKANSARQERGEGGRQKSHLSLLFHRPLQTVNFFSLGTMNKGFRGSYTFHPYSFLIYIGFNQNYVHNHL